MLDWFDHYLTGTSVSTGPNFAYFRDWISYSGNAAPAYATSSKFPVGSAKKFYLSGNTALSTSATGLVTKSQAFVTPPAGPPTSLSELDALGSFVKLPLPETDLPGTFARWTSPPLATKLDVVGSPTLNLQVIAPTAAATQTIGPAGQLVLFARVQGCRSRREGQRHSPAHRTGPDSGCHEAVQGDTAGFRAPLRGRAPSPPGRRRRIGQLPRRTHAPDGRHQVRQSGPGP